MSFQYKGLAITADRHLVTAEEVERQLQRLREQNPRITQITHRPTENGDEIQLDYAGFCDGVRFPGGTGENQTLVLGSGMFIPGFEEQLLDKVPGQEVTVRVTFPAEYHAPELAGKAAEFHCVIRGIRVKTPYELDDTFAREVGRCENMEQMRQKMEKSLQEFSDERGEMDLQDRLLQMAAETLDFTPGQEQLDAALEQQMQNLTAQLAQRGLTLEMYCGFLNTTAEAIRQEALPSAMAALRSQAAVEQIVKLENLTATPEEIAQALAVICRQNNLTMEQLKPYYDAEMEQAVINSVLTGKVMALIRSAATVTGV